MTSIDTGELVTTATSAVVLQGSKAFMAKVSGAGTLRGNANSEIHLDRAVVTTGVVVDGGQTTTAHARQLLQVLRALLRCSRGERFFCGSRGGVSQTTPTTTSTTPIRQLLGIADAQTAHPATSSTAPAHQPLGSTNA